MSVSNRLTCYDTAKTTAVNFLQYMPQQGAYSQYFIFFVTYDGVQQAVVFHYIRQEQLYSSLGPILSYEENEVS